MSLAVAKATTPPRYTASTPLARPRGSPSPGGQARIGGRPSGLKGASHPASRDKTAKLRIGRVCRGCLGWRRVEFVGAEAGAGEEPQACPFAELGEHVAGFGAQQQGKFAAAPLARGLAGDDGGDPFPPG